MGCCCSKKQKVDEGNGSSTKQVVNVDVSADIDFLLPNADILTVDKNKVIAHTKINSSTICVNKIISSGIWRCEFVFSSSNVDRFIGIVDAEADVPSFYSPGSSKISVGYSGINGNVFVDEVATAGCEDWKDGDVVAVEVDMTSSPSVARFYHNSVVQPVLVSGLPHSIRFCASFMEPGSEVEVKQLVECTSPLSLHNEPVEVKWIAGGVVASSYDSVSEEQIPNNEPVQEQPSEQENDQSQE
ncbi:uncharacterized protein MONOS_9034 [Monocercomonoides exilis]|uniref:uncharacterized protein n=1 Tax=Monocercomonoides exilis TaxID=2049356 RepID=UPI00355A7E9F|nr:hypothetical protein MONOS_9034 [Monocercomonoides exilis]|eukprot:MONOS_9034.1-p1 / transcript=MONOS_9034.1 / gene=MONOS_9034 / organism=Monocercomonoides_exilis_PA203 / gene_product=unspecified product / transcript_product=unspecified product / location=Mono_scaffold00359:8363-9407(-) / protein_length=243 / sequence_SO=supercontig / SO=protein_coding / is_pseudo=false